MSLFVYCCFWVLSMVVMVSVCCVRVSLCLIYVADYVDAGLCLLGF